ncbi:MULTISPECIES: endonuclease V [unclassified Crossiella]|uniref:endonuclease V n=1 Tax=unclassified Crossiella TaxID=2620835 RepID=UPI001FFE4BBA|nr:MULTISPECIES: endonuclease V [unclassified Crossiella]MCK2239605.1 endonuclease V [Crossiella sp. S99.2]MCK2252300.1 endonuclease V [Crossiella sp. S99.1]
MGVLTPPATAAEARAIQQALRPQVDSTGPGPQRPVTVAGLDVAYAKDDRTLAAAVVLLDFATQEVLAESTATGVPAFDYIPGLFAFRELPALLTALSRLPATPDLLVVDGHGLAHPHRFGLACHLGVLTGLPVFGVGKTRLIGTAAEPGPERGAYTDLVDEGEVVGRVLRTRPGVKPVYVSVGHRIDLDTACAHTLALTPRYRLPETTRAADQACRRALAAG